ncbi:unnamed protein product [Effrenium voratum]|nr:unnamed protein product [Effrenium voratum]
MQISEEMSWQAWLVLGLILSSLVLLFMEVSSPDQVMMGTLCILWNCGIVSTQQALDGFSNTGLVSIAALFIVMHAVDKSRVVDCAARRILGNHLKDRMVLLRVCGLVFVFSGFCNNTPLVVLFMPVLRDWARSNQRAPSTFLIPLSYASIMGGMLTTIGTSTNLLINGLLEKEGIRPFNFFEPAILSLPIGAFSLLLLILLAPMVLPNNKGGLFREVREHGDNLVTALDLAEDSAFLGKPAVDVLSSLGLPTSCLLKIRRPKNSKPLWQTLGATQPSEHTDSLSPSQDSPRTLELEQTFSVRFLNLDIEANSGEEGDIVEIQPVGENERVQNGDLLLLSLPRDRVVDIISKQERGIRVRSMHASQAVSEKSEFVELVISANSTLVGQPVCNAPNLVADTYNAGLIAVRSRYWGTAFATAQAEESPSPFHRGKAHFMAGDVILVLAPVGHEYPKSHFFLVTHLGSPPKATTFYDLIPIFLFVPALVVTGMNYVSMTQIAVTLSTVFILGGWVKAAELRSIVDWQLLILIGASLGVASAMSSSGLAAGISRGILGAGVPTWLVPGFLYLIIMTTTEMVTNNAAAALGVPLALDLAKKMELESPHSLVMIVMLAASTSFASPIGYATNLIVMGPGGYSFLDFLRLGGLLDLVWLLGVCALIPWLWPMEPLA